MKHLYLKTTNTFALDSSTINADTYKVTLMIVGEDGELLDNNDGNPLVFSSESPQPADTLPLTFDNTTKKFKASIRFKDDAVKQYVRAYWTARDADDNVITLNGYYPEDVQVDNAPNATTAVFDPMIVPASYFIDSFLGAFPSISAEMVQIIAEINAKNPDIIKNELLSAQDTLEMDSRIKFFQQQYSIVRDLYAQEFFNEYWLQQVDWYPLVSADSFKLLYGKQEYMLSNELKDSIVVDKKLGTLEFVPVAVAGSLYTLIINTVSALGVTLIAGGERARIPALFHITYTAGLDFPNLPATKKANIRTAISRRAFINLVPRIDPLMREMSISSSIDGASLSRSSGTAKIIEQFEKDNANFIAMMQKEYGTGIAMVVS